MLQDNYHSLPGTEVPRDSLDPRARLTLTDHCHFQGLSLLSLHSLSLSLPRSLPRCCSSSLCLLSSVQWFISNTRLATIDTVNTHSMHLLDSFLQQQIPFHPHYLSPRRISPPPLRPFTHPQLSRSLHVASHTNTLHFTLLTLPQDPRRSPSPHRSRLTPAPSCGSETGPRVH